MNHLAVPDAAPTVSVIMNCLNGAAALPAAMDSLMAQSFTDFEVIFFDNASTDASPAIARSYGPKVRYFRAENTVPLGAARNLALAEARGSFLAFLDCDDLWRAEKLSRQVELFRGNPRLGLVCTDTEISNGKRTLGNFFSSARPCRGMVFDELMQRQWISMSSAMLRREALASLTPDPTRWNGGWFDESLNVCEEADVFYRIAHDWEVDYIDESLTVWRVHEANTTFRKFGQFADETLRILEKHRRLYPGYDIEHADVVETLTKRAAFQKAVSLWREGHSAEARRLIRPWRKNSRKHRLFWWGSYLPGSCFDFAAKLYFALPTWMRR